MNELKELFEKLENSLIGLEDLVIEYTYDDQVKAQMRERLNDIWSYVAKLEEIEGVEND